MRLTNGLANRSNIGAPMRCLLSVLFVIILCSPLHSQQKTSPEEGVVSGLIGKEIDQAIKDSIFQVGAFRFLPGLQVLGGYDSNAFSSAESPQADETFRIIPAIRTFLVLRDRSVINLDEALNMVYYREQASLRDVYNTTHAAGSFGGNRWLIKADDSFETGKIRPSSEFDIPTDQRTNSFNSSVTITVGERSDFSFSYGNFYAKILDQTATSNGIPVSELLDRTVNRYSGRVTRETSETSSTIAEFVYEKLDFAQQSEQPDATIYTARAGFQFAAGENISGQALIGYKNITPEDEAQNDYRGLVGSVNLRIRTGERASITLLFSRDPQPSVAMNNWFFIGNNIGGTVEYYLTRSITVNGGITGDKNTYDNPILIETVPGQPVLTAVDDSSVDLIFGTNIHLSSYWWLFVGGDSLRRRSNLPDAEKNRVQINAGLTTRF